MSANIPVPNFDDPFKPLTRESLTECWENATRDYEQWHNRCESDYTKDLADTILEMQVNKLKTEFSDLALKINTPRASTALWKCCKTYEEFLSVLPEAKDKLDALDRERKEQAEREQARQQQIAREQANKVPSTYLVLIDDILKSKYNLHTITSEDMVMMMKTLMPEEELQSRYFGMIYYATYQCYTDNNPLFLKCRDECLKKQYKSDVMLSTVKEYLDRKCGADDMAAIAIEKDRLLDFIKQNPEYKDVDDELFLLYKAIIAVKRVSQEQEEQEQKKLDEMQASILADLESGELYSTACDRATTRYSVFKSLKRNKSDVYKAPNEKLKDRATPEVLEMAQRVMEQNKKMYAELESLKKEISDPNHRNIYSGTRPEGFYNNGGYGITGSINLNGGGYGGYGQRSYGGYGNYGSYGGYGGYGSYGQQTGGPIQLPITKIMGIICGVLAMLFLLLDKIVQKNLFTVALGFIMMAIGFIMPVSPNQKKPINLIIGGLGFLCVITGFIF